MKGLKITLILLFLMLIPLPIVLCENAAYYINDDLQKPQVVIVSQNNTVVELKSAYALIRCIGTGFYEVKLYDSPAWVPTNTWIAFVFTSGTLSSAQWFSLQIQHDVNDTRRSVFKFDPWNNKILLIKEDSNGNTELWSQAIDKENFDRLIGIAINIGQSTKVALIFENSTILVYDTGTTAFYETGVGVKFNGGGDVYTYFEIKIKALTLSNDLNYALNIAKQHITLETFTSVFSIIVTLAVLIAIIGLFQKFTK